MLKEMHTGERLVPEMRKCDERKNGLGVILAKFLADRTKFWPPSTSEFGLVLFWLVSVALSAACSIVPRRQSIRPQSLCTPSKLAISCKEDLADETFSHSVFCYAQEEC